MDEYSQQLLDNPVNNNGLFATGGDGAGSAGANSRTTITISDNAKLIFAGDLELSEHVQSHTDLTMTGGTIDANGTFLRIGHRGSANVLHTGGRISGNWVHLAGHDPDATAVYTLNGTGATLESAASSGGNLVVGEQGIAHFYHLNGMCKGESVLSVGNHKGFGPWGGRGTYVQTGGTVQTAGLYIGTGWEGTGEYSLYAGELQADRIELGLKGEGTFHLGDANGVGWIKPKTTGGLLGLYVYDPTSQSPGGGPGTFRGWSYTSSTGNRIQNVGSLENSGYVIADSYGNDDRELRIDSLEHHWSLTNANDNAPDERYGWYAVNHGKLLLPKVELFWTGGRPNWGEGEYDAQIDLVNSVHVDVGDATLSQTPRATLEIALLAADRAEVPPPPASQALLGVWNVTLTGVTWGTVQPKIQFRYDHARLSTSTEQALRVMWVVDGNWSTDGIQTTPPDTTNHIIEASLPTNPATGTWTFAVVTDGSGGANTGPIVDAGPDQTITMPAPGTPAATIVTGTASDDGLPNPPGMLTYSWSVVSGPGTVTFSNPYSLSTTVTFSAPGVYVLQLTVSDGEFTWSDTVTIFVGGPVNQAPIVDAGPDQIITLPNAASLNGFASDDGLPNPPGELTHTWSVVSGPGTVTFADASLLSTTATFITAGTYVLQLTAFDGALTGFDAVTITVNPALPVHNLTQGTDWPTIQAAINAIENGDLNEIVAEPGTYAENIVFGAKRINLHSGNPNNPAATTILAAAGSYAVNMGGCLAGSALCGFTISGGMGVSGGWADISQCVITGSSAAGIHCADGSISHCTIQHNYSGVALAWNGLEDCLVADNGPGGGIIHSFGLIENCQILRNTNAVQAGGGIASCGGEIRNSLIAFNVSCDDGGGVASDFWGTWLTNCTIAYNSAGPSFSGGGVSCSDYVSLTNCIVYSNGGCPEGRQLSVNGYGWMEVAYSDVEGGEAGVLLDQTAALDWYAGNIDTNPRFINVSTGDFHLQPDSLCINAGDQGGDYVGQSDIDGDPRVAHAAVDMGADEVTAPIYLPVRNVTPTPDTQWPTIQAAINAAVNGDEIEVSPGTYYENLVMRNVGSTPAINFTLRSTDPNDWNVVSQTIIDAGQAGPGIVFHQNNSAAMLVSGLTIRNGSNLSFSSFGGGLSMNRCAATIRRCIITDNTSYVGGGIDENWSLIDTCVIKNNSAVYDGGGGLLCPHGTVKNCLILGNQAPYEYGEGGGCFQAYGAVINCVIAHNYAGWIGGGLSDYQAVLSGCTIINNVADEGGGYMPWGNRPIQNCIFWGNVAYGTANQIYSGPLLVLRYCDVANGPGDFGPGIPNLDDTDIHSDPNLVVPASGSWTSGGEYTSANGKTTLTDLNASWTGSLAGKWIDVNTENNRFYLVVTNTATTIQVWGDASADATLDASYRVLEYHLQDTSLCVSAGNPAYVPQPDETDIDVEARVQGGRIEIGCDEVPDMMGGDAVSGTVTMPEMAVGETLPAAMAGPTEAEQPILEPAQARARLLEQRRAYKAAQLEAGQ